MDRIPLKRLGAGPKGFFKNQFFKDNFKLILIGSSNDFTALKSHTFFEGICFETLSSQEAPKMSATKTFKKQISKEISNQNSLITNSSIYDEGGLDLIKNLPKIKTDQELETMGVGASLSEGKILLTGLVLKKCGWVFYKPRQLILKDSHKLFYYDPQTNKLKVIIIITIESKNFRIKRKELL